jgi:hypothetical protein
MRDGPHGLIRQALRHAAMGGRLLLEAALQLSATRMEVCRLAPARWPEQGRLVRRGSGQRTRAILSTKCGAALCWRGASLTRVDAQVVELMLRLLDRIEAAFGEESLQVGRHENPDLHR